MCVVRTRVVPSEFNGAELVLEELEEAVEELELVIADRESLISKTPRNPRGCERERRRRIFLSEDATSGFYE